MTICGTEITSAPEVLEMTKYDNRADIYSLGVVFYYIVFGEMPFTGKNKFELLQNI